MIKLLMVWLIAISPVVSQLTVEKNKPMILPAGKIKIRHLPGVWVLTDLHVDESFPNAEIDELREIVGTVRLTFTKDGGFSSSVNSKDGLNKSEGSWTYDENTRDLITKEGENKREELVQILSLSKKKLEVRVGEPGMYLYMDFLKIKKASD